MRQYLAGRHFRASVQAYGYESALKETCDEFRISQGAAKEALTKYDRFTEQMRQCDEEITQEAKAFLAQQVPTTGK